MNFDSYKKFGGSLETVLKAKQQAEAQLVDAGYALPTFTSNFICNRYNKVLDEEELFTIEKGKEPNQAVGDRIDFLKEAAQINLYKLILDKFNNGEKSIELAFNKGMPDKNTKSLLSTIDPAGGIINHTREGSTCLPEEYHSQHTCIFTITPEGDSVMVDGKPYGNADPVIGEINNMIKATDNNSPVASL